MLFRSYNQDKGYTPEWPGMDTFKGQIVHPMEWTEDIDYAGKNVLVIGSGATTATVVLEFTKTAKHVTVLQRSPTYFIPGRNVDDLADTLRQLEIDEKWIHEIVRRKRLFDGKAVTEMSFNQPEELKAFLLDGVKALLPEDYDMKHFTPSYRPWQQRIAFVPDGDLFAGIKAGKATMVTDEIETFNATGVLTKGGVQIDADLIVPATGFHLSVLGDIPFSVDGTPTDCVNVAITHILKGKPDLIVSGVNTGWNLGDDVTYSGTVSATFEGTLLGIPSVAFSQEVGESFSFDPAARFAQRLIAELLRQELPKDLLLNVNVPDVPRSDIRGVRVTRLGKRHKAEPVVRVQTPRGESAYWIGAAGIAQDAGPGTDFYAVESRRVSVTPDRKSTRLNSSHMSESRMPSSA